MKVGLLNKYIGGALLIVGFMVVLFSSAELTWVDVGVILIAFGIGFVGVSRFEANRDEIEKLEGVEQIETR
jgi:hypothetical protein